MLEEQVLSEVLVESSTPPGKVEIEESELKNFTLQSTNAVSNLINPVAIVS
jgi:hypothetical protein